LCVFAAYAAISFLYLGLSALVGSGSRYVGRGYDPQIFIWDFAWWPHAISHGQNPFVTHAVWAPDGVNLAWATTVPALSLLFLPLTLLAGAILSYDVAAVLMPALAAWSAFLLCRYLIRSLWPSLVGGYLFGFSSYLLGQVGGGGHLHLAAVALHPLVALVVLRYLDRDLDGRGLVLRLGPLLALELLTSSEVAFTLSLALAVGLVLCVAVVPSRRRRVVSLLPPLAGSYVVAAVIAAPFLYFVFSDFQRGGFTNQDAFVADLANLVVPTQITAAGGGLLASVSHRFPGNIGEQGLYLGLPTLAIVVLFACSRWRSPAGRFLLASLALAVLVALGGRVTLAGHVLGTGPWDWVKMEPLFDNVLTTRVSAYVSLLAAVIVALWTASRRTGALRIVLPALAVAAIVPAPGSGGFATGYVVPPFFTSSIYESCLDPGETVLPFPFRGGNALLWQVESGFRFRMAGGDIGPSIPPSYETPGAMATITGGSTLGPDQAGLAREFIQNKAVTSVVVDGRNTNDYAGALNQITTPRLVGGVALYQVQPNPPSCLGG
jgi:hypothetical protein